MRFKQIITILYSVVMAGLSVAVGDTVAATSGQGLPRPDHVVIVIEENHGFSQIIDAPDAPFINALAKQGALLTQSFGVTHPSQPNYLALFSGSLQGLEQALEKERNSCPHQFQTPNLGSSLLAAGLSFSGYSEGLPEEGAVICQVGPYRRKHNPWVNWQGSVLYGLPASTNRPLTSFPDHYAVLPTVSIVVPNQEFDMHDGMDPDRIRLADAWLKRQLEGYVAWARTHNSLLIVTWDEDNGKEGNRIPTILVGPMVCPGRYDQRITHYHVLRTIEEMYGLSYAGHSADVEAIRGVWCGQP
jgi:acid phosphatase